MRRAGPRQLRLLQVRQQLADSAQRIGRFGAHAERDAARRANWVREHRHCVRARSSRGCSNNSAGPPARRTRSDPRSFQVRRDRIRPLTRRPHRVAEGSHVGLCISRKYVTAISRCGLSHRFRAHGDAGAFRGRVIESPGFQCRHVAACDRSAAVGQTGIMQHEQFNHQQAAKHRLCEVEASPDTGGQRPIAVRRTARKPGRSSMLKRRQVGMLFDLCVRAIGATRLSIVRYRSPQCWSSPRCRCAGRSRRCRGGRVVSGRAGAADGPGDAFAPRFALPALTLPWETSPSHATPGTTQARSRRLRRQRRVRR